MDSCLSAHNKELFINKTHIKNLIQFPKKVVLRYQAIQMNLVHQLGCIGFLILHEFEILNLT